MAPKKAKKISLNEFLGDTALGSWADEMDSLPNAPAVRNDDDPAQGRDRYSRNRDDFMSSKPDRSGPPREDLPMPTAPPYTAFIGNLAFDLTEQDIEEFFGLKTKSIKIIKGPDEKPKGFGYVEFEELDGLKDAMAKTGTSLSGRTIRVSVAEPPKERPGFGAGFDDGKFDNPWRREGPLADLPNSRDSSRRRFDGPPREERLPSLSEGPSDWRSNKPRAPPPDAEGDGSGSIRRKAPGFVAESAGAADAADTWTMGSKFKASAPPQDEERSGKDGKFGSLRGRGDMGPPKEIPEESDWRSSSRRPTISRNPSNVSPTNSTPPTPQLARRKLELLPRTGSMSGTPSPLSSPKMGPTPTASATSARSNPFGAAKPVDVSNREKEVAERVEKEREVIKERFSMSRTNSRTGTERTPQIRSRTPPTSVPSSPRHSISGPPLKSPPAASNVRPSFSFAAAAKRDAALVEKTKNDDEDVDTITEKVAEVEV
ncbi:hypothetical protein C8J56DRAFT_980681 [Mycena floridula]|nr:hypothetical protein C8J56DRAFT_980681 [Mycena floridula]